MQCRTKGELDSPDSAPKTIQQEKQGTQMMKVLLRIVVVLAICLPMTATAGKARVFQAEEIIGAQGAAWLKRSPKQVDGRVMAKVSLADTPYTIWWVIFNKPHRCAGTPCGTADLNGNGIPDDFEDGGVAADVAVFNAGGAISAASGAMDGTGVINLDISVLAGEGPGNGSQTTMGSGVAPFMRDLNRRNGLGAEIHIVIDRHAFDSDWVTELTYPEVTEAFAVFLAVSESDDDDDDDDD